jgi:hypothetical protein
LKNPPIKAGSKALRGKTSFDSPSTHVKLAMIIRAGSFASRGCPRFASSVMSITFITLKLAQVQQFVKEEIYLPIPGLDKAP